MSSLPVRVQHIIVGETTPKILSDYVMNTWADSWKLNAASTIAGGQGVVVKVVHLVDGRIGALKQLRQEHLESTERRFRMQQESNALLALGGDGVPNLLDANVGDWNDKRQSLYFVMEWIEGPTLSQYVGGNALPLDDALTICRSLLETVARCHALDIHHRDVKPDNIILRNGLTEAPVLVDFGMSWTKSDYDRAREFKTKVGQEIGNRFLRLPEHTPGRHLHDPRSDLTLVVGLLFYTLTGEAPRSLRDLRGAMPHEVSADCFAPLTTQDPRWPRIRRIFNVGFQENIDFRFQTTEELLNRLSDLSPPPSVDSDSELNEELSRINDLLNSEKVRQRTRMQAVITEASSRYLADHNQRLAGSGFVTGGSGPNLIEGGRAGVLSFFIVQQGMSEPQARFTHRVEVIENEVIANVSIENDLAEVYYRGPVSDVEALWEAVKLRVPMVLATLFRVMHTKLESQY